MERMHHTRYDDKMGEISSPMDSHISRVDEGDKELHLKLEEEKKDLVQGKEQKQDTTSPDSKSSTKTHPDPG